MYRVRRDKSCVLFVDKVFANSIEVKLETVSVEDNLTWSVLMSADAFVDQRLRSTSLDFQWDFLRVMYAEDWNVSRSLRFILLKRCDVEEGCSLPDALKQIDKLRSATLEILINQKWYSTTVSFPQNPDVRSMTRGYKILTTSSSRLKDSFKIGRLQYCHQVSMHLYYKALTSNQSENINKSGTAVNLICRSSKIMF